MTAIRLADEFGFRLSLGHCDKAYLLVDELAKRKDVYRQRRAGRVRHLLPELPGLRQRPGDPGRGRDQGLPPDRRRGRTAEPAPVRLPVRPVRDDRRGRPQGHHHLGGGSRRPRRQDREHRAGEGRRPRLPRRRPLRIPDVRAHRPHRRQGRVPESPGFERRQGLPVRGLRPAGDPRGGQGRRPLRPEGRDRLYDGRGPDRGRHRPGQGREDRKSRQGYRHSRRLSGHRRREIRRHARARPGPDAYRPGLELADAFDDRRELPARDPRDRGQARHRAPGPAFLPGPPARHHVGPGHAGRPERHRRPGPRAQDARGRRGPDDHQGPRRHGLRPGGQGQEKAADALDADGHRRRSQGNPDQGPGIRGFVGRLRQEQEEGPGPASGTCPSKPSSPSSTGRCRSSSTPRGRTTS